MASMTLELKPFPVPEEVYIKMPTRLKQDGVQPLPTLKLSELGEETLAVLCEEFTNAVFAAAGKTL